MPTYKLGRSCVADVPGIVNDDIMDVDMNVQGTEEDVTVFKSTAVTNIETMVTLADVSFDVTCTAHDCAVGDEGDFVLAGMDTEDNGLQAVVLDIKMAGLTPKGVQQWTVSYGVNVKPV
jgi:hypothetical protein